MELSGKVSKSSRRSLKSSSAKSGVMAVSSENMARIRVISYGPYSGVCTVAMSTPSPCGLTRGELSSIAQSRFKSKMYCSVYEREWRRIFLR
jgi:hypothetical protein